MAGSRSSVYSVVNLIYMFAKPFGMAPYAIGKKGCLSTFHVDRQGLLNMSITLTVCFTMLYSFSKLIALRQEHNYYNKVNIIICILMSLRILSAIITVVLLFVNQDQLISAYERLNNFDKKKKMLEKPHYTKSYNGTLFVICVIVGLLIGIEAMYYYGVEEELSIIIYDTPSNGLQFLIHMLVLLYFELYVTMLLNNFKFIKLTTTKINKMDMNSNGAPKETLIILRTISLMYDDLCKGADFINQVFSFPLFSLISLNFLEVLLGVYLLSDHKTRDLKAIFWTSFYIFQQFCLLTAPGTVGGEAREITKFLSEAELHTDEELSNERNHFLLRTLHQTVEFQACGFFPISMSAIIGQFSISISFLLFVFQIIK